MLEKVISSHMNSIHRDTNRLLMNIYFLISNMVGGISHHTEYIVLNTGIIKQMFQVFKFKKQHKEVVEEMILVCFNSLQTGTNIVFLELIRLKLINFLAENLYATESPSTIILCLKTLGCLVKRAGCEVSLLRNELEH